MGERGALGLGFSSTPAIAIVRDGRTPPAGRKPIKCKERVQATVSAEVEVEVKITNQEFSDQLTNNGSDEYKTFEKNFKAEMVRAYKNVPGFKDVEILAIRQGSIIVDHKVIMELELKPNISIQDDYKEVVNVLKQELKEFVSNDTGCNRNDSTVFCWLNETKVDEFLPPTQEELCQRTAPANYTQYYFPHFFGGGSSMSCVTYCNQSLPEAINCNYGECRLLTTGPQCFCEDHDTYWYSGDRCNSRVSKGAVYGGFAAALAVLVIIILTVTVFWQTSNKKRHLGSERSGSEEGQWYEDTDELDVNEGITIRNTGTLIWEDQGSSNYSSTKEKFRPSLDKVDTSLQVKIQRPEVTAHMSDV
ncbi:hypothetical protein NDU88_004554 [Pleurodeles waltl]|uniref:SEA domain-containing protein n=1 Tax=Pleurodeles waltl TaxID=8319 RepID=A0AAV7KY84_PLEWA|nr:hypothetical protein NDU88_004554 [Pleurodeles waltl]